MIYSTSFTQSPLARLRAWFHFGEWLPWLVLFISLAVTYQAWKSAQHSSEMDLQNRFDFRVREVVNNIEHRMLAYEQVLRGVNGLFTSSGEVERDKFRTYIETLHLNENYHGIQSVGFAQVVPPVHKEKHITAIRNEGFPKYAIWPDGQRDFYTSIIYIEPFVGRNPRAFGYDMYTEPLRRVAMNQARDSGKAAVSGKVKLVLETDRNVQAGCLMYLPVYTNGASHDTIADRRANILGWIVSTFRMNDLMSGVLGERSADLDIEIFDGKEVLDDALMYDADNIRRAGSVLASKHRNIQQVTVADHTWTLAMNSLPEFEAKLDQGKAQLVAITGISATLLLTWLTWLLVIGRGKALLNAQKLADNIVKNEKQFRISIESLKDYAIITLDPEGHIRTWNAAAERIKGYWSEEVIGKHFSIFHPPEDVAMGHLDSLLQAALINGSAEEEGWRVRKDGSRFQANVVVNAIRGTTGELIGFVKVTRDITDRKSNEEALKRRNRALVMLSRGNRTLVRSTNEKQLLQAMCNLATEIGGYRMAWVGYKVDDAQKSVLSVANSGLEDGYLERAAISWGDNEQGQGPTGLAIRTGQTQVVQDVLTSPHFFPWREEARKRGYSASIALPLMHEGNAFGAMTIYAGYANVFDEMEVPLLEEMAEDLSFGVMALRNNTAREKAEKDVEKSYSLLQAALESTADGIFVSSLTGEIESFNRRFVELWGIPSSIMASGLAGKVTEFLTNQVCDAPTFLHRIREITEQPEAAYRDIIELKSGLVIERISQPQYLNGLVIGRVCSFRDITEQKHHEAQLTHMASHDILTSLPNRNLLDDRLEQAIAHGSRSESYLGVLLLDLDRFKLINDSMGHRYGDLLLKEMATKLAGCMREGDTVARMGGDEFVILLPDLMHDEAAAMVANNLIEVISMPVTLEGRELFSTVSIGISLYPRDGTDAPSLLQHADAAMYRAKRRGGNCFQFFTNEINDQVRHQLDIASKLRYAIERKEFLVYYQPQFEIQTGRLSGAEALIRWQHPEMGMVSPMEFIPIAEETGIILAIGEWVAEMVGTSQKAWRSAGLPPIKVAINLSARQLDLDDLPQTLLRLLVNTGVDPHFLELEITESMLMKHPEKAQKTLHELKSMGFSISIDDFGTGYSSLGYLKRFPIDKIKIDRSFIIDIPHDGDDVAITRAVIAMAHELRLKVVAEGVETEEQLAFLRQHGCDFVQGYLTGRPMPTAEFESLLRTR